MSLSLSGLKMIFRFDEKKLDDDYKKLFEIDYFNQSFEFVVYLLFFFPGSLRF